MVIGNAPGYFHTGRIVHLRFPLPNPAGVRRLFCTLKCLVLQTPYYDTPPPD